MREDVGEGIAQVYSCHLDGEHLVTGHDPVDDEEVLLGLMAGEIID